MNALIRSASVVFFLSALAIPVTAHESRPAYLQLTQVTPDTMALVFKVPAMGDMRLSLYPRLPQHWEAVAPPLSYRSGGAIIEMATFRCYGESAGETITMDGLSSTLTDVLVRFERLDGSTQVERLSPSSPSFVIEAGPVRLQVAATYTGLGIEHILLGVDHLLFVACLVLVAGTGRRVLITITGFTLAHSVTLALSALDLVRLPVPPVEAAIALSIVFVVVEIARGRSDSFTFRYPIAVSTLFGLLHGFGFAAALRDIGLPQTEIPVALLCFNLGVEIGQIAFVGVVAASMHLLGRVLATFANRPVHELAPLFRIPVTYLIGSVASYWLIARVGVFWQ